MLQFHLLGQIHCIDWIFFFFVCFELGLCRTRNGTGTLQIKLMFSNPTEDWETIRGGFN